MQRKAETMKESQSKGQAPVTTVFQWSADATQCWQVMRLELVETFAATNLSFETADNE